MMPSVELSETSRWLIQLLIAALALGTAAWFYLDFAPRLRPDIAVAERDSDRGLVVLRLTVENVSRVLVHQVPDGCRLQVVARPLHPGASYDEFVPLSEEKWDEEGADSHLGEWRAPQPILRSTAHWYPGDRISVDHLVAFPSTDSCLQVALQVRGRLPWYVRILMGARAGRDRQRQPKIESWTTTTLILPELTRPV